METYYVFFYLCVDVVNTDEQDFRFALWEYHSEIERLRMLETFGSQDPKLVELRKNVQQLQDTMVSHPFYKTLKSSQQKDFRNGQGVHVTNTELSTRAGIDANYYRSIYKSLSQYVHT